MLENNKDYQAINQAFPHLGQRIKAAWGQREFAPMMHELIHDTREGSRRGFSLDALMSLHNLTELHRKTFVDLHPADMWDNH